MKTMEKFVPKITRDGDKFSYTGYLDKEAKEVNMLNVFRAAAAILDTQVKIVAALGFLEDCFTVFADTGKGCNEYQTMGVAAICRALTDMAQDAADDRGEEHKIIEAMAAGDV